MATRDYHTPRVLSIAHHEPSARDAGLLGLETEIRATPTDQLAEMATLLIELSEPLRSQSLPRLRLTLWELRRRTAEGSIAA